MQPPLPSVRKRTRPPAPSRAGSPADVSQPCAQRPRGGRWGRRRGSRAGEGLLRGAESSRNGKEVGAVLQPAAAARPLCRASLPHTWMYRNAVRSTLKFEVFLSSTLGMLRFSVSKHSFRWALLGRGGRAALVSQRQEGGDRVGEGRDGEAQRELR